MDAEPCITPRKESVKEDLEEKLWEKERRINNGEWRVSEGEPYNTERSTRLRMRKTTNGFCDREIIAAF